jgi:hypothetical protein
MYQGDGEEAAPKMAEQQPSVPPPSVVLAVPAPAADTAGTAAAPPPQPSVARHIARRPSVSPPLMPPMSPRVPSTAPPPMDPSAADTPGMLVDARAGACAHAVAVAAATELSNSSCGPRLRVHSPPASLSTSGAVVVDATAGAKAVTTPADAYH